MSAAEVRCVCFDLGGVLVRVRLEFSSLLAAADLVWNETANDPGLLTELDEFREYQAGRLGDDGYFQALAQRLAIDKAAAQRVHDAILIEPYAGTLELIHSLHEQGLVTGCLSNTNAPHWETMLRSGRFPNVQALGHKVASHEIVAEKPDLEAYRAFESQCGFAGHEIVFFDDSPANVEGARAAGWRAFEVPATREPIDVLREALESLWKRPV